MGLHEIKHDGFCVIARKDGVASGSTASGNDDLSVPADRRRKQAQGLVLPQRPLIRLAQVEEPNLCGGQARGRRGLT
jgi:hypothetical protein